VPLLTLLASTHAFRKDMASSRTVFHLALSLSLETYNVYRLVSEEASEITNGYIDLDSPNTALRLRNPLLSELPSRRLSDTPMNGPSRRKSKGIGWQTHRQQIACGDPDASNRHTLEIT
jgi:hypothetical protein